MAVNPMQRRSRNSFIAGLIIGLVVTVVVSGLLLFRVSKLNSDLAKEKNKLKEIIVANRDISANSEITVNDIGKERIVTNISPAELEKTKSMLKLIGYGAIPSMPGVPETTGKTKKANSNNIVSGGNNTATPVDNNNKNNSANNTENNANSNANNNAATTPAENPAPNVENNNQEGDKASKLYAAINIPKGTVITSDMLVQNSDAISQNSTVRTVEYSTITLPSELLAEETIDVRISFPTGQDFVVLSKKFVKKADAESVWIDVDEEEILRMNSAIIESYLINGAKLYAVNLSKPGIQKKAIATYPVNSSVYSLLNIDPNVSNIAKDNLMKNSNILTQRTDLNEIISNAEDGKERVGTAVQQEIKARDEKRKQYIEKMTAEPEVPTTTTTTTTKTPSNNQNTTKK